MPTIRNILDWLDDSRKVQTAVRIAIVPPWKIQDVEGHYAMNFGTLVVTATLFMIMRQLTPNGGFGITEIGILIGFVIIFLFGCGFVVSFVDPTDDAPKVSNRWSTFMIVTFLYSIFAFIILVVGFSLTTLFSYNLVDLIGTAVGDGFAYAILAFVSSVVAVAVLYWRTSRWFRPVLQQMPNFLGAALTFCAVLNSAILFVVVYLI